MDYSDYFLILFCSFLSLFVATFVKKFIVSKNFLWIASAFLTQTLLITSYYILFQRESFETTFVIIKVLSAILTVPLALFIFDTKLESRHFIGLLLGTFAIYCLR